MSTPARTRADRYAAMAPDGAEVTVSEETGKYFEIAQVVIRGSIDTILITIGNRPGKSRTRCHGSWYFNSGSGGRDIPVGHLDYRIRNLYIDTRKAA